MSDQATPSYSQWTALLAMTRAGFKAIFANPIAIVFSVIFPIVFVLIFSAFGSGNSPTYKIALLSGSDTTSAFYRAISQHPSIKLIRFTDSVQLQQELIKGKLTGSLLLTASLATDSSDSPLRVQFFSTTASGPTIRPFLDLLDYIRLRQLASSLPTGLVSIDRPVIRSVRKYLPIDFVLPGQLGFSILFSTLFGIAFTFYGLREQGVLKRFFATPIHRINILIGIGISRISFQLLSVMVLLLFGHWVLDFTLQNGWLSIVQIVSFTILMLLLLMGVGLIFSSIAKTDATIPLLINLFALPQMLLSGTFFSVEVFPLWLQRFCEIMPLKQFNDAVRKISFEGLGWLDCGKEFGILLLWMVLIYVLLSKLLRWE
ncbi:MAG: ABC transporter permease [Sphingomonadales bacterium]|nr:ABC transporter permease [Sphingomonadales bacterium]